MPVFEGLLPEPHNTAVLSLLYLLCHWHGLAKLRMHTEETLSIMDKVTQNVGDAIRTFVASTCPEYDTKELKCEALGRQRREARARSRQEGGGSAATVSARRPKALNLRTYKLHALGDYTASIRMYGTTDSYSTQTVSTSVHCVHQ
jgi:hypothetical protein